MKVSERQVAKVFGTTTRRQFLRTTSLIALAPTIPAFLTRAARADTAKQDGRILVVIQLDGGNDGINTVVPFADDGYRKQRKQLGLPEDQLIKVNDSVALHPSMRAAMDLLEDGRFCVVQGVGYPNPNRSHDVSMAIWQTARFDPEDHDSFGWLGRAADERQVSSAASATAGVDSVLLGDESPPIALQGRRSTPLVLADLSDLKLTSDARPLQSAPQALSTERDDVESFARRASLDAYAASRLLDEVTTKSSDSPYPQTQLARRLKCIAQLIKADFNVPIYYAMQSSYDTHAGQLVTHANLLAELAGALKAFHNDLKTAQLADHVITLCFSEFGRRVEENASLGTDHGTAGPVFLAGPVSNALIGTIPSMTDLEDGDLKMQVDFRQVYATLLQDWLSIAPEPILGESFSRLSFVHKG